MTLIPRQEASHWYLPTGEPFHTVPRATGEGTRHTTLADARKVGAYPSVTNILSVLSKPALDAWKQEQAIMAALTLPRNPDEPLDAFAHRVVEDMGEQVGKAAEFGTAIHAACEDFATTGTYPFLGGFMEGFIGWWYNNVEEVSATEQVFVHPIHGYAGRVDMVARLKGIGWAVVDFKTQGVKRDAKGTPKPAFYETWPLQLSAYSQAIWQTPGPLSPRHLVSVIIDSTAPGPVHVRVWEPAPYFEAFLAAMTLWKYVRGYDATQRKDHDESNKMES